MRIFFKSGTLTPGQVFLTADPGNPSNRMLWGAVLRGGSHCYSKTFAGMFGFWALHWLQGRLEDEAPGLVVFRVQCSAPRASHHHPGRCFSCATTKPASQMEVFVLRGGILGQRSKMPSTKEEQQRCSASV